MESLEESRNAENAENVETAVEAWHRAGEAARHGGRERLSELTRRRILSATTARRATSTPLSTLFATTPRLVLAGVLPALLLSLALGLLARPAPPPGSVTESGVTIRASKQGGDVVFVLANGGRSHRIYRTSTPEVRRRDDAYTTARGAFRDRLDAGGELVFYRID